MGALEEQDCIGDFTCHHCHVIYCVYGASCRCDICGRKLRWASAVRLKELEVIWSRQEHRKGLDMDFAYRGQQCGLRWDYGG